MFYPRKPRPLKPHQLSVLVIDANKFSRNLIGEILRSLSATDITLVPDAASTEVVFSKKHIDVVLLSCEPADQQDGLRFVRAMRRLNNDRVRRLPVLFVTTGMTKELVMQAREAGVDEFLSKPISPAAVRQRLEMVIETPRPFVDCSVFIGPCRRRKNPADYHGAKRRAGERDEDQVAPTVDKDEEAAKSPIRIILAEVRSLSGNILAADSNSIDTVVAAISKAKTIADANEDHSLNSALAAYEAYITVSAPLGQMDPTVVNTALGALEQLATLPVDFTEARESVAIALGKAIKRKLAA